MPVRKKQDLLARLPLLRHLHLRPRLWSSVAVGIITALVLPTDWIGEPLTRGLIGWNVGASLYLVMTFVMMARATSESMRSRAKREDEGQHTILVLVILATVAVLVAIAAQLAAAKDSSGAVKALDD